MNLKRQDWVRVDNRKKKHRGKWKNQNDGSYSDDPFSKAGIGSTAMVYVCKHPSQRRLAFWNNNVQQATSKIGVDHERTSAKKIHSTD